MKLSFIIPVYNCEKYIGKCIESVLKVLTPPLKGEIILINDGSKDHSLQICQDYATQDERISVIDQPNKGASSARNAGLNVATGDYIWFVDADDSVCPAHITELLKIAEQGWDVIQFKYNRVNVDSQNVCQEYPIDKNVSDGTALIERSGSLFLWDKLFKREIIGNIRFAEGTKNIEDLYFNVCVLPHAKTVAFLDQPLYNYVCISTTSTSRSHNKRNLIKLTQDTLFFQKKLIEDIANAKDHRTKKVLQQVLYGTLAGHIFSLMNYYNFRRVKKVLKIYKAWGLYPLPHTDNRKSNLFATAVSNPITLRLMYMMIMIRKRI